MITMCQRMIQNRHEKAAQLALLPVVLSVLMTISGCIQVTAPDKPIEIVLNINIKQEVVYRLDSDAKQLIQQNTEIF